MPKFFYIHNMEKYLKKIDEKIENFVKSGKNLRNIALIGVVFAENAIARNIYTNEERIKWDKFDKIALFSVRCIKN